jgi:hypothetical protein
MLKRLLPVIASAATLAGAGGWLGLPAASAATLPQGSSANWAGYVANSGSSFTSVSGSWVQPSADPSAGDGYSAFWVGLGGDGSSQSGSLEQIGTQADVVNGQTQYYAWYELVPAGQVELNMAIHPGDHLSASVSVSGANVTVSLSNQTTGQSYTNTLQMSNPDTSSAEWVAEAPSASDGSGDLQTLPLADFGTVGFTGASATAGGHTGSISDASWSSEAVQLGGSAAAGAQASSLSSDGSSFSVAWQSSATATDTSTGGAGSGYGDPGGYGAAGGYGDAGAYGGAGGYGYYSAPGYLYGY